MIGSRLARSAESSGHFVGEVYPGVEGGVELSKIVQDQDNNIGVSQRPSVLEAKHILFSSKILSPRKLRRILLLNGPNIIVN